MRTTTFRCFRRVARYILLALAALCAGGAPTVARAHDVITSSVTFNREIRAIVQSSCAACHRPGGTAFSLLTYQDARPWAKAIQEEVLRRRMPPWGVVPGFGSFRHDPSLTQTQLQQIAEWAEGGAPEGEPISAVDAMEASTEVRPNERAGVAESAPLAVSGAYQLSEEFHLAGMRVEQARSAESFRITAELPDGSIVPLLWIGRFNAKYPPAVTFREPLALPAGTLLRGVPEDARIVMLPAAR